MILTHASRKKDFSHTSFAEILAFQEILQSNLLFRSVEIRDYSELESVAYVEDLTIFAAGPDMHETIVGLAKSCKNLYVVVQDPNWPTSLSQIRREFVLITPFRALEDLSLEETVKKLNQLIPTLSTKFIKAHRVIDFGSMLAYNAKYADRYWDDVDEYLSKSYKSCYVGSLKKDRIRFLELAAHSSPITFYGNFTREDFKQMSKSKDDFKDCEFAGRIEPTRVLNAYLSHEKVIFCPDDIIFDLDTSYLRIGEMCLANATPKIVSDRLEVLRSLDHLKDEDGRLSWVKFVQSCQSRDLILQIQSAFIEVI